MKEHIENSIKQALNNSSKLTEEDFKRLSYGNHKHQMSSRRVKHLLNNLCSYRDCIHLAIGLYKGGSLCASLKDNQLTVVGIDNWSHDDFDPTIKRDFDSKFSYYDNGNVTLIEKDCFSINVEDLPYKFNFYYYDGQHDEESQKLAITHFADSLDDYCIFMVDDYNLPHVQNGTRDGIDQTDFVIEKEWKLFSKRNGDLEGWWNGIYLALLKRMKNA